MKLVAFILLSAGMLVAQVGNPLPKPGAPEQAAPAAQSTTPEDIANAKQARAVLDKMIEALGGPAYLNVQDMEQNGRLYGFDHNGEAADAGSPFVRYWKWPDKDRLELLKHRDWILVYNGNDANETTYHGTHPLDAKALKGYLERRSYSLDQVIRGWLKDPSVAVYYDGQTVSENKQAEKVSMITPDHRGVTLYIDANSHLPLRKTYTTRDPETGDRVEESESFDNYRLIQGIQTPTRITRYKNDIMTAQRFISEIKYNTGIPDSKFDLTLPSK
jgi:hypothetical protein